MKLKRDLGTEIENLDTVRVRVTACHRPLRVGVVEGAGAHSQCFTLEQAFIV